MNCDEFLESLESLDEPRRTAARWHANSCPSCAALANVHDRLQTEFGAPEPLPPAMRAVWEAAAADESPPTPLARRASEGRGSARQLLMQLVSLAAALLLFLTVALLIWQQPKDVVKNPDSGAQPAPPTAVPKTIDASAELNELLAQVNALEAELNKTAKQAELVDVRREANVFLATYNHW